MARPLLVVGNRRAGRANLVAQGGISCVCDKGARAEPGPVVLIGDDGRGLRRRGSGAAGLIGVLTTSDR